MINQILTYSYTEATQPCSQLKILKYGHQIIGQWARVTAVIYKMVRNKYSPLQQKQACQFSFSFGHCTKPAHKSISDKYHRILHSSIWSFRSYSIQRLLELIPHLTLNLTSVPHCITFVWGPC